ncbi:MAG TPA: DMT family transporter [Alphaproteobacteria bacterium]|nr:DMT family transporter [Alphaproteobacteria bacterium]
MTTSKSPQAGGAGSHHPVLAALTLCLGVFVFALQDWIIKKISGGFPVHQAIIIRCIVALPILLILVRIQGQLGDLISPKLRWLVLRGVILVVSYTTYYLAFPAMPLANVIALWFTTPLFVTALAGPLLGETVGAKRWAAAIIGFVGVLIMVRPFTDGFDAAGLLPIVSALSYGTAQLMARRMGVTETAAVMSFYQNLVFLLVATAMALLFGDGRFAGSADPSLEFLFRAWAVPEGWDLLLLGLCGVIASAGMVLLTQAYRMAEANFVTSFEYTAIIWATLGGWWFWNEIPDKLTLVGALLIVGAGLYMLYGARPSTAVEIEPI